MIIALKPRPNDRNIQRNISQHCWAQHVACVWPPCCDMLRVGSSLKLVKFEPTTPNTSQQIATRWPNARNMLRPTMLGYVASACCDGLAGALHKQIQWKALAIRRKQITAKSFGFYTFKSAFTLRMTAIITSDDTSPRLTLHHWWQTM